MSNSVKLRHSWKLPVVATLDLYEHAPVGYCTVCEQGVILEANLAVTMLLGFERSVVVDQPLSRFILDADLDAYRQHRAQLTEGSGSRSCKLRMVRSDDTQISVQLLSSIGTDDDGGCIWRVAMSADAEHRPPESTELEQELRFAYVLEATQDGVWDWNVETDHVYLSPQWKRLLGYEPPEVKDHVETFYALLHPDDLERVHEQTQRQLAGLDKEKQIEIRLRAKSGEYRWFLDRGKVVARDAAGNATRMVGTISDIEERKLAERLKTEVDARIREREGRLRKAQAISKIGNFHWTAATDKVVWSDELFRIYGQEPDKFAPSFAGYLQGIHPDDRARVTQSLQQAMGSLGEFDHQYRVVRPDGQLSWVHALGRAIADGDGEQLELEGTCQDISERRKAEDGRIEAQDRLQKIASRVPGVVFQFRVRADNTYCYPYSSEGMNELFGVKPSELIEDGTLLDALHHPDDREALMSSLEVSRRDLAPWIHEFRLLFPDGTERWISINAVPEREADGSTLWHGFMKDATERKRAEEALRWNQSLLQMMSNSSPLAFLVVDNRTDDVLYFNSRFCEIWDIEGLAERMLGGELKNEDLFSSCLRAVADAAEFAASCAPLQDESNRSTLEDEVALVDGRIIRCFSTQIRDDTDRYYGRFYMFEDITARKEAEAERDSLQMQLRESQKMEAIGTLAGGIAHDFNNILAVILGNAQIAEAECKDHPSIGPLLGEIRKAGIRARDLVQQILSFSRQRQTTLRWVSLALIVEETASLLNATLPARLTLDVECDAELPRVLADATQLQQIIINLATNSMQAIGGNPGNVSIRLDTVVLDRDLADTNPVLRDMYDGVHCHILRLTISDNGPGMDTATAARAFEPFFTTKAVGKGTGLGLAVVHGIVTAHGGAIVVESQAGKGTSFAIYLMPASSMVDSSESSKASAEDSNVAATEAKIGRALHILFLDDNEAVLRVARRLLEASGYRVTAFANQQDALAAIQNDPAAFDLVVTDYNMPGMSGLDVSRVVREIRPSLPVAVTSGFVGEELRQSAADAGVLALIPKPFVKSELLGKVEQLVAAAPQVVLDS